MPDRTGRRRLLRVLSVPMVLALAGCSQAGENTDDTAENGGRAGSDTEGLVTVAGDETVEATVSRIESAIADSPLTLITRIDHAENAASTGERLPPTTLLLFGNPDIGTPLMRASRTIGLDLPQRMLVWEENGHVHVTYNDPSDVAERHGIEGQGERLETVSGVLQELATGEPSVE